METSITAGPLLSLAVTVTSEQHVESVLRKIVEGLASQPGVALVRIWLLPSVHVPNAWQEGAHFQDGIEHLRLAASAGNPIRSPGEDWSFLQGQFSRFPLNMGKVGQVAADRHPIFIKDLTPQDTWVVRPEWAEREEIRSFAGHPLIFHEKLLGVIGLFSRRPLDEEEFTWLGLFASHAAVAIADARAFEEVAERQKAEAEVRKLASGLEAKIRRLVEANVVGIVMFTLEGAITEANDAFLQILQYSREDLATGRVRWMDLTPAEWRARDEQAITELQTTGLFRPFEKEYFRKDGSRVPVLLAGALFEGSGNEGVGFSVDLSEQKQAESALRRSEAFLAEGQRLGQIGSYSWRVARGEITWSEQLYRIYEFEIGVPLTLDLIRTRVHPEDLTLYEKMVEQARNGENDFEWHYRLLMPDHSIKYLHAVARATRDRDGQLEYIAAIQDVTARRLSEEARDKARSELAHVTRVMSLGMLTASIAHEINQPLSGIVTNASTCQRMLAAEPPNVDGALETARRTIRDANRASEVITRLRALFSRKATATGSVDLNDATREVIALSLTGLQRNQVVVRAELAEHLPLVMGDRVQLQQVILNLLRNAADAMSTIDDRARELLVRTGQAEGNQVRLSVKDAGVGFKPEAADKIFEGFYSTKTDGMGIGLSISRSIIETHHGHLWATQNDGPGSTFWFVIPCALQAGG
ncbi:MAG TPA: ATP-binding protein [Bryobacteraceae bacterium]|nr:ATP-binding protein [Bryobacteraceae bacterium]